MSQDFPKIHKSKIHFFQKNILEWYSKNGRKFPWRLKSISNYEKIIAEVLLQRTKAETISEFYKDFIKRYPSWNEIAITSISELELSLKPVGLWRQRSVSLKKLSDEMVKRKNRFPKLREEIESLPGVGQYIANSIEVLVHNRPRPLLDVNMARVLERFFGKRKLADIRYDPYLQNLSQDVVVHTSAMEINWGVLDFASKVCKIKNPGCGMCVMRSRCNYLSF